MCGFFSKMGELIFVPNMQQAFNKYLMERMKGSLEQVPNADFRSPLLSLSSELVYSPVLWLQTLHRLTIKH